MEPSIVVTTNLLTITITPCILDIPLVVVNFKFIISNRVNAIFYSDFLLYYTFLIPVTEDKPVSFLIKVLE